MHGTLQYASLILPVQQASGWELLEGSLHMPDNHNQHSDDDNLVLVKPHKGGIVILTSCSVLEAKDRTISVPA